MQNLRSCWVVKAKQARSMRKEKKTLQLLVSASNKEKPEGEVYWASQWESMRKSCRYRGDGSKTPYLEEQVQLVLTGRLAQECVTSSCYPLVKALCL